MCLGAVCDSCCCCDKRSQTQWLQTMPSVLPSSSEHSESNTGLTDAKVFGGWFPLALGRVSFLAASSFQRPLLSLACGLFLHLQSQQPRISLSSLLSLFPFSLSLSSPSITTSLSVTLIHLTSLYKDAWDDTGIHSVNPPGEFRLLSSSQDLFSCICKSPLPWEVTHSQVLRMRRQTASGRGVVSILHYWSFAGEGQRTETRREIEAL